MKRVEQLSRQLTSSTGQTKPTDGLNYGKERLNGKVAFITGAASGIGRATAIMFGQQGAKIYITDVQSQQLAETKTLVLEATGNAEVVTELLDVSNQDKVKASINACIAKFGRLDICFANAGVLPPTLGLFHDLDSKDFNKVLDVNVKGVFHCFKYAGMIAIERDQPLSMIATASVAGLRSGAGDTIYSASKAAVISLVQTIANQLTGTKVRCNAICPGLIETGMTKPVFMMADENNARKRIGQLNPMSRYGEPEEIASVALFLASDDSSYVTGQAIAVDGGLSSSLPVAKRKKGHLSV